MKKILIIVVAILNLSAASLQFYIFFLSGRSNFTNFVFFIINSLAFYYFAMELFQENWLFKKIQIKHKIIEEIFESKRNFFVTDNNNNNNSNG